MESHKELDHIFYFKCPFDNFWLLQQISILISNYDSPLLHNTGSILLWHHLKNFQDIFINWISNFKIKLLFSKLKEIFNIIQIHIMHCVLLIKLHNFTKNNLSNIYFQDVVMKRKVKINYWKSHCYHGVFHCKLKPFINHMLVYHIFNYCNDKVPYSSSFLLKENFQFCKIS